jgi:sterol desaturase/sphingolipid hydroxylase (fatty acid hydroxylase superfamily)
MITQLLDGLLRFFDLRGFLLVCIIFVPLERLLALHPGQRVFRKWWWNDLIYVVFNRLFINAGLGVLIVGVIALTHWLVPAEWQAAVAAQPYWLQVGEVIVLADLGFYSAHRMFHTIPWLWKFHAIHHSIEELDWLAAARVHPLDQIVTKGVSVLPLFALGFAAVPIGIFSAIYFWHSILVHANVRLNFGPLRWLIASPEFHHWHHANERAAYNTNYAGQLSILDKLFGTMYMPEGRVPAKYGVDEPVPNTYIPHLLYPLKQQPADPPATGDTLLDRGVSSPS